MDERMELEKNLSLTQIEKFERKFEALEHSKSSLENKYHSDVRAYKKNISELEEKLEYLTLEFKESEQKNKIFQFQLNEYKNEQKAYQRKLNENQAQNENVINLLKEKEQENKILLGQLNAMKKVVKHNAVAPLDPDVTKQLQKIKNEESINNLTNNQNEEQKSVRSDQSVVSENEENNIDDN